MLERTLESHSLDCKEIKPVNPKEINPEYSLEGLMLKLKLECFDHLMQRANSLEKPLMLGKIEARKRKGPTEDEMVEWHHRLNGHEFRQTPGGSEGQGSLECCSPWGHKESNRLSNGTTTTTLWFSCSCCPRLQSASYIQPGCEGH